MLRKIKFSFIIPTYNRGYCISNTIKSVLEQNFTSYEIIVVDDGSEDNTEEVINSINSNKINYVKLKQNVGVNIARNKGADIATGSWLVFLDSDDLIINNALFVIHNLIKKTDCDLLFVACESENGESVSDSFFFEEVVEYKDYLRKKIKGRVFKGEYLPCVKKEVFLSVRFFENIIGGEGLTWLKITKTNKLYVSSKVCRLYNNVNEDRLSVLNKKNIKRILKIRVFDIRTNSLEYLKHAPFQLIKNMLKIVYYSTLLITK